MIYEIKAIKPTLFLITWNGYPSNGEAAQFIRELTALLNNAKEALYFISDLRKGCIVNVRMVSQLVALTQHPKWGGSTAFSKQPISRIFLNSFERLLPEAKGDNNTFEHPEEAISYLEMLAPELTKDVNWQEFIK